MLNLKTNVPIAVFIILLLLFCIGCKNKDDKVKELIKQELSKTMNDFKSYEPVEFGKLDSTFTAYDRATFSLVDTIAAESIEKQLKIEKEFNEEQDRKEKAFKKEFTGYAMTHTFRGKNSFGAMVLSKYRFFFNKELTKVTESFDVIAQQESIQKLVDDVSEDMRQLGIDTTDVN